ncbi:TMEM175 family protein [Actinoallomurus purpureus]|uniref:TMEM175 family protein n=1 Tax=Actinoallomurus purpureus TaxID=478114 RepID=UPI0020932592|nr:TMEM175 family protein [Actinoallomurus purpureus]MCO6007559.1 TMEM175 family protein [Actinoallomurus purpureus]
MTSLYHRVAGASLERLSALNDGVFAIVLTLLVLDLHVPAARVIHRQRPLWSGDALSSEGELWHLLGEVAPNLLTYLMSFLTLGMFYVGAQTLFNHLRGSDRNFTWLHLTFLLGVSLLPFTTALLAKFMTFRIAVAVYWVNLLALGLLLLAGVRYARAAGLLDTERTPGFQRAFERRIVIPQVLYATAFALCVVNTYLSIALVVLLQLNSAIAPNIRPLNRF